MAFGDGFWKVELHVHLDGSYRPSTILELAREQNIQLPSSSTVEEFAEFIRVKKPGTLADFLTNFPVLLQVVAGNREAIKRTAYEFVEDCALQKMAYVETRFAPHFLAGDDITPEEVVSVTLDGIREASKKFGTKCNVLLTSIREKPEWAWETLELAKKFLKKGVVGIDIGGGAVKGKETVEDGKIHGDIIQMFQEAKKHGIPRTVHAGENGPADSVRGAVFKLDAHRIGHGYRVLQDMELYEKVKAKGIHFETCPLSSRLTGGASPDWSQHPIITFARDRANYSISTDCTILTGFNLSQEYDLCQKELHLDAGEIVRCNFNAARSSFLEDKDKSDLIEHMRKVLGAN